MLRDFFVILLWIALGLSYIIFYYARREEKMMRIAGYIIGSLIMAVSIFYIVLDFIIQTRITPPLRRAHYYQGMMRPKTQPGTMQPRTIPPAPSTPETKLK